MAPCLIPWDSVLAENHRENEKQMVCAIAHKAEDIDLLLV
jgi:hypothetical protein